MASPAVIDIERLLKPIEGFDTLTGNDPRANSSPLSSYQIIKTARYAARDAEKNNLYTENHNDADSHWRKIIEEAPKLLEQQAKDLDVATWLTEALTRRYGFVGLRDALQLIEGLVTQYWDHLYPMPDEDGIETRVAQFAGLNGRANDGVLTPPIRRLPITEGYTPGPFTYFQYQQAVELERTTNEDAKESKAEKLGFNLQVIEQAVAASDAQFFIDLLEDIELSITSCRHLEKLFETHCGLDDAPSMRSIINVLEECSSAINHLAKYKLPVSVIAESEALDPIININKNPEDLTHALTTEAVFSREVAFKQLIEISKFFKKTEPHSPVSHALEKAVKWGNMALEELIVELIPDDSARKHFTMLTGVKHIED